VTRIALTVNFSPWSRYSGGGQRSVHNLALALSARGHRVTVVYTRPPWEHVDVPPRLPYELRWAALPAVRSRADAVLRPLSAFAVAAVVAELARCEPALVVHGNGEEAALLPQLRRRLRFGLAITPRYPSFPTELSRRGRLARAWAWARHPKYAALGLALRSADRWCPTSGSAAESVERAYGLSRDRCRVVPNGLAPEFAAIERRPDAARGPIVFFGRMAVEKGPMLVLEALARLGDPTVRTLFVGRGAEQGRVRERARTLGLSDRVEMIDWLAPAALAERLAGASTVVLPSREESFGNAMVEAMATGAPLVTTRAGSIPELLDDGVHADLVPVDDVVALTAAIARLRREPARADAIGRAARAHVAARYGWDATARAFEAVYAELGAQ
jgi:glycosyltransferase involved in cell wall biosynthesis